MLRDISLNFFFFASKQNKVNSHHSLMLDDYSYWYNTERTSLEFVLIFFFSSSVWLLFVFLFIFVLYMINLQQQHIFVFFVFSWLKFDCLCLLLPYDCLCLLLPYVCHMIAFACYCHMFQNSIKQQRIFFLFFLLCKIIIDTKEWLIAFACYCFYVKEQSK